VSEETPVVVSPGVVTVVTLNRPEAGNRVDGPILDWLADLFEQIAENVTVQVVVVRGAGQSFCTGREPGHALGTKPSAWRLRSDLSKLVRANRALQQLPAVTIAAVQGDALGFGCGLAIQCDLTVASKRARFAFPEINTGLPPTVVISYLGHFIPRKIALEMVLTGETFSADACQRLGLVNRVVEPEDLDGEVERLATALVEKDALAARTTKQFFAELYNGQFANRTNYALNLLATTLTYDGD
jgi:enoyl-CoA hydratase/carnithine racemase